MLDVHVTLMCLIFSLIRRKCKRNAKIKRGINVDLLRTLVVATTNRYVGAMNTSVRILTEPPYTGSKGVTCTK